MRIYNYFSIIPIILLLSIHSDLHGDIGHSSNYKLHKDSYNNSSGTGASESYKNNFLLGQSFVIGTATNASIRDYSGFIHFTKSDPSSLPGIAVDFNIQTRDYDDGISLKDIESTISIKTNDEVWLAIVAQNVVNLDTYQVEITFDPDRLEFINGMEENPFSDIHNLLKKNGGSTIGFQAVERNPGVVNVSNSLTLENVDEAPEGSGIIGLLRFKVIDTLPDNSISLINVHFMDTYQNDFLVTNTINAVINPGSIIKGDYNNDGKLDLSDVIIALQILTHANPDTPINLSNDTNNDQIIDFKDLIYMIEKIGE